MSNRQETVLNVFDRKAKRLQRDRIAELEDYKDYELIKEEIGYRTYDRLCDIKRDFEVGVELGAGRGYVSRHILKEMMKVIFQCELSGKLLRTAEVSPEVPTHKIIADEEFIPFKENSVSVFFSSLSLHWVNDLPGCFRQVLTALKPDGVFLGSMFGGETLFELRVALQLAEQECEGGFGPHVSPFTEPNDVGNLLSRAGFTMLTLDIDEITVHYPGIVELMDDLKGMAENNCAWNRKPMLHRNTLEVAENKYREMYGTEKGLPATYQIINFIGWKPDPSQVSEIVIFPMKKRSKQ
ncbi:hypothetical protein FSP39_006869 [Pinctada imbricata]|uniref:Arginine-hydroxylase NDUFAF5, mitochondrial n=1 Tax=Pinctada imbricata TaxID=66713 RepID=A0AA88XYR4_PINIB|nr:hypothetical protein FSP39_006869 [Pinctada imbricata]